MLGVLLLTLLEAPLPLEPGSYWEYRESYTEQLGAVAATQDEVTRFEVRGSPRHPFLNQIGGADPSPGPIEQGPDWLRMAPWTGEDPLPLPLEVGRKGPASEAGGAWTVEAEEQVEVPAGSFKALRCAIRTWQVESVLWIAPGIGVVRETQGVPGKQPEIERVLLRWGAPKH